MFKESLLNSKENVIHFLCNKYLEEEDTHTPIFLLLLHKKSK